MTQKESSGARKSFQWLRNNGTARVWGLNALIVACAALVVVVLVPSRSSLVPPFTIPLPLMVAVAFLGESLVVHLQFKRDAYSFSLSEMTVIFGLFFATPETLIVGQLVGSGLALVVRRQSLLKVVFNVSHYVLEAALATVIFNAIADSGTGIGARSWLGAFLAAFSAMFVSIWMVAFAISLSEGRLRLDTVPTSFMYGGAVMATNISLALIGVETLWLKPEAAWLLVVPVLLLFMSYRAYLSQREKRETVELLYESSRSVQHSRSGEQAIITLLTQAREMFRAETAQLTIFSEDEECIAYRTTLGPGEIADVMQRVELNPREGVWARVASEDKAILIPRPIENERLRLHFAARHIFKDAMVAPLSGGDGVIGTLLVGDRLGEVSTFDQEDLKMFETLANHASVSLENARLVDRLKESLAHLTEMNRLKDDFVAAVSHELRTPLTSIQGYVKTLLRPEMRDYDPDAQVSFLEAVDRQSERLRSLIEDLLVVARLDAHEVSPTWMPVNVERVADRVLVELRDRASEHELSMEVPADIPTVESDEGKIQQIVTNLVDNACKYSPSGTKVRITGQVEGDGVTISVVDQGNGIPLDQHERIFDRFYQVDQSSTRKVGGTGLGLYLCRRLAEALGGRVWLERSDESGSTFSLWVPSQPPVAPPIRTSHSAPA